MSSAHFLLINEVPPDNEIKIVSPGTIPGLFYAHSQ